MTSTHYKNKWVKIIRNFERHYDWDFSKITIFGIYITYQYQKISMIYLHPCNTLDPTDIHSGALHFFTI